MVIKITNSEPELENLKTKVESLKILLIIVTVFIMSFTLQTYEENSILIIPFSIISIMLIGIYAGLMIYSKKIIGMNKIIVGNQEKMDRLQRESTTYNNSISEHNRLINRRDNEINSLKATIADRGSVLNSLMGTNISKLEEEFRDDNIFYAALMVRLIYLDLLNIKDDDNINTEMEKDFILLKLKEFSYKYKCNLSVISPSSYCSETIQDANNYLASTTNIIKRLEKKNGMFIPTKSVFDQFADVEEVEK